MHVALAFGILGLAVVFITHDLPRRPPAPPDWDPYRWRLGIDRLWPRETPSRELIRVRATIGARTFDRAGRMLRMASSGIGNLLTKAVEMWRTSQRRFRGGSLAHRAPSP